MGFMKTAKEGTAATEAARAMAEGHSVFVFKFGMPNLNSAVTSSVSGAAEVIETIEGNGWHLEHVALHPDIRHGYLVMVFRPAA